MAENGIGIGKISTPQPSNFVPTTRTVAGLSLSADIPVAQLQEALGLSTVAKTGSYSDLLDKPEMVQANWGQTVSSAADFIKNKPNLGNYQTKAAMAGVIQDGVASNATTYPSVAAVLAYAFSRMGGTFAGKVKAFSNDDATDPQLHNIYALEGGVSILPSTAQNGDIVFLYDNTSNG